MKLQLTTKEAKLFAIAAMNALESKDYPESLSGNLRVRLNSLDQHFDLTSDQEDITVRAFMFWAKRVKIKDYYLLKPIIDKIDAFARS